MEFKNWNIDEKPSLEECPRHYCFCWTPPGGEADLSRKIYDSFADAVSSPNRVTFLHGGCAAPFGPCKRETKSNLNHDCYESHNRVLKKHELPELFFCNPENLDEEDKEKYKKMAKTIWSSNA
ncbi:hypothetical protein L2750_13925 [Shewanella submarina]|uniref:Uncharacterized protein n=1 Tax=Shewanella submarina TaxID=2016376 RepID=A0ABV7GEQ8_9GAMM|nr:hypothetical protein [Shewanella submarina]MCL1038242.1 hypothetical protein [Shewanella submarina]